MSNGMVETIKKMTPSFIKKQIKKIILSVSLPKSAREYRKRFRMTLNQWLLYHQKNVHIDKCYWMGVEAMKNPFDTWIYQEIIYEIKPDIILEIGSGKGGGTLFFANMLDLLGKGTVISIDIKRNEYHVKHERIVLFTGDSSSPEIVANVSGLCRGKSVLVVQDGGHTKEQVLKDLEAYKELVSVGSYFIVEDGIIDLFREEQCFAGYTEGPLAAVEVFLKNNADFVADKKRERYILTYNPRGFLKRVR